MRSALVSSECTRNTCFNMPKSSIKLPEFIHIGKWRQRLGENSSAANASHPPPDSPPPSSLHETRMRAFKPSRGILKTPSYKFSGIRIPSKTKIKQGSSTPTTVGTNESMDDDMSHASSCGSSTMCSAGTFGTTSSEGIKKAIDKIILEKTRSIEESSNSVSNDDNKGLESTSDDNSVTLGSTSSSNVSTNVPTTKEELQKFTRINHIKVLNERISEAKARKLVERKAYRREDKLLMRLARQMKTVSKRRREIFMNMERLKETHKFSEDRYNGVRKELEDLKASRMSLNEDLRAEKQRMLLIDREKRERILRVQKAEFEAHTRSHQLNCQELCESILIANNEVDRLRTILEERTSDNSSSGNRGRERQKKRRSRFLRSPQTVLMIGIFAIVASAILVATVGVIRFRLFGEKSPQLTGHHWALPPQTDVAVSDVYPIIQTDLLVMSTTRTRSSMNTIDHKASVLRQSTSVRARMEVDANNNTRCESNGNRRWQPKLQKRNQRGGNCFNQI